MFHIYGQLIYRIFLEKRSPKVLICSSFEYKGLFNTENSYINYIKINVAQSQAES